LTRGFPQRPKLGTRDIYATLNEPYITKNERPQGQLPQDSNNDQTSQEKDIVAAMCQPPAGENTASAIHFRDARCIWQAIASSAGPDQSTPWYRFNIKNEANTTGADKCRMFMQWEKRALTTNTDGMAGSSETEHFVLLAIDRKARRKSRIATMNRGGFEINVRKSSILDHLRTYLESTDPVSEGSAAGNSSVDLEVWLYTHVLTLGVWVASQEGWLN
jgi:hypothetical protein